VKNGRDYLLVLNKVAHDIIEEQQGIHLEYVFLNCQGRPVKKMVGRHGGASGHGTDFPMFGSTILRHSFGCRLRAAGVSFEDRQDLLGHKSGRITTHYSAPELRNLIQAAERACAEWHKSGTSAITRNKNLALVSGNRAR